MSHFIAHLPYLVSHVHLAYRYFKLSPLTWINPGGLISR